MPPGPALVGSHRNVHVILSGMSAEDQLTDNLATFARFEPLTAAETAAVEQTAVFLHSRIKIGCTGCRYCMPCPMGVDIPDNFSIWNKLGMFGQPEAIKHQWEARFPDAEKAATASAAASARRPAPSICPSAMRWPSCSRSWISCNLYQKSHRQKPVAFFSYSLHSIPILSSIARRSGVSLGSWVVSHSRIRRSQSPSRSRFRRICSWRRRGGCRGPCSSFGLLIGGSPLGIPGIPHHADAVQLFDVAGVT